MPTFQLDDHEVPFQPGDTILGAAERAGLAIPHYCWHAGLSVAANCRMCLVELLPPPGRSPLLLDVLRWDAEQHSYVAERKPKLVPACQQTVSEGMKVRSDTSAHVKKTRAAVQELLLLNHPVDCPICDQAGECRLQDYWLEHQHTAKRMRDEPVHKPKAVRLGPHIVYDAERCILCTRCVRFCQEVAKDPVLSVARRGNRNEIIVAPGRELDHPYSMMTEHICPVGALTSADFRFRARVWFLRSAKTICTGCARGCNAQLDYDPRSQTALRHRPRHNAEVNGYWMCDTGMLDYRRIHEGRVLEASVEGQSDSPENALKQAADTLGRVEPHHLGLVLGAEYSLEDNAALLWLGRELGVTAVFASRRSDGPSDEVLIMADKNPNQAGLAQLLGGAPGADSELAERLEAGTLSHLLWMGQGLANPELTSRVVNSKVQVVLLTSHQGPLTGRARVLLPATSWAEAEGHYVNALGKTQLSERALSPLGQARSPWRWVQALAKALGKPVPFENARELRQQLLGFQRTEPVAASAERGASAS